MGGQKRKSRNEVSVRRATYDALKARAKQEGTSVNALVERIVVDELNREEGS